LNVSIDHFDPKGSAGRLYRIQHGILEPQSLQVVHSKECKAGREAKDVGCVGMHEIGDVCMYVSALFTDCYDIETARVIPRSILD
jgi:hypothetical protein